MYVEGKAWLSLIVIIKSSFTPVPKLGLLVLTVCFFMNFSVHSETSEGNRVIPRAAILANSDEYHDKCVTLFGKLRIQFEGNALFMSNDSYDVNLTEEAVWLDLTGFDEAANLTEFSGKMVFIKGSYDSRSKGHFGLFHSTIKNIVYFDTPDGVNRFGKPGSQCLSPIGDVEKIN